MYKFPRDVNVLKAGSVLCYFHRLGLLRIASFAFSWRKIRTKEKISCGISTKDNNSPNSPVLFIVFRESQGKKEGNPLGEWTAREPSLSADKNIDIDGLKGLAQSGCLPDENMKNNVDHDNFKEKKTYLKMNKKKICFKMNSSICLCFLKNSFRPFVSIPW